MDMELNIITQIKRIMKDNLKKDLNLGMGLNMMKKKKNQFLKGILPIMNTIKTYNYYKQQTIQISKWLRI